MFDRCAGDLARRSRRRPLQGRQVRGREGSGSSCLDYVHERESSHNSSRSSIEHGPLGAPASPLNQPGAAHHRTAAIGADEPRSRRAGADLRSLSCRHLVGDFTGPAQRGNRAFGRPVLAGSLPALRVEVNSGRSIPDSAPSPHRLSAVDGCFDGPTAGSGGVAEKGLAAHAVTRPSRSAASRTFRSNDAIVEPVCLAVASRYASGRLIGWWPRSLAASTAIASDG